MSIADHTRAGRPFTGMGLDRAVNERRDPAWIARRLEDPPSRAVVAGRDGVLMGNERMPSLARVPLAVDVVRVPLASDIRREPILLGIEQGVALFAVDLDALPAIIRSSLTRAGRVVSLRDAGTVLSRAEGGLAAYLLALLNWHRKHRFCANCGARTSVAEAGYSRRCARCDTVHFPRTDPVVIMTVEHQHRLLLGRHAGWPRGRYSLLAGFISPGESAEEAVLREVREESGILARHPTFVTSQPWPFPSSLMLGFDAHADGGVPRARDGELEDVQWFERDAVRDALRDGNSELHLPPPISIARFLIERWVGRH